MEGGREGGRGVSSRFMAFYDASLLLSHIDYLPPSLPPPFPPSLRPRCPYHPRAPQRQNRYALPPSLPTSLPPSFLPSFLPSLRSSRSCIYSLFPPSLPPFLQAPQKPSSSHLAWPALHLNILNMFPPPSLPPSLPPSFPPSGAKKALFLPPRTALALWGEARYVWTHGIPDRRWDKVRREGGREGGREEGWDVNQLSRTSSHLTLPFSLPPSPPPSFRSETFASPARSAASPTPCAASFPPSPCPPSLPPSLPPFLPAGWLSTTISDVGLVFAHTQQCALHQKRNEGPT